MHRAHTISALCLSVLLPSALLATSNIALAGDNDWEHDWTVLTVASSGAWGTATDGSRAVAISQAIRRCRSKPKGDSDCGSLFTTTRAAWSLGYACGNEMFIVTDKTLPEALQSAMYREIDLREIQHLNIPPCELIVAIAPSGTVHESWTEVQAAQRQ